MEGCCGAYAGFGVLVDLPIVLAAMPRCGLRYRLVSFDVSADDRLGAGGAAADG